MDNYEKDLRYFCDNVLREITRLTSHYSDFDVFKDAVSLILETKAKGNRIHVTGIGKMHHVSSYYASLLSSIGYPAYLLDGTEATHGSSGQVGEGDLVICLSYYGSVEELNRTVVTLKNNSAKILAVTGFDDSFIAKSADIHLNVHIDKEGDLLGKPPRMSVLSTLYCLLCLSILLQGAQPLTSEMYIRWHPSGKLGEK